MKSKDISGKTRVCALIGDPVEHSMSPVMHNAAFRELGLDFTYVAFRVQKENVTGAIGGMRAFNLRGLNVTIPHKVAVIPLLDELDPLADKIGAVNTIVNNDGVLKGYNTDAGGFLHALLEQGIEPERKNVVIIGAGGVARAAAFVLADRNANITILNRIEELNWAVELAGHITQTFGKKVDALELNPENLKNVLTKADILVNATSVGMSPKISETPVNAGLLRPGLVVYDIVYNPIETRLLKEAAAAGCKTISGLDMFVGQGALAFELWTGQKAPVELMKKEAKTLLEKSQQKA
jgi:shikimate dehydrogenase